MSKNHQDYMNVEQAVAFMALPSKGSLYALVKRHQLPYIKLKRRLLFDRRELEALLDDHRVKARD